MLCVALLAGFACTSDDDDTGGQAGTSGSAGRAGSAGAGTGGASGTGTGGKAGTAGTGGAAGSTAGTGGGGSGGSGVDASAGSGGTGGMEVDASDGAAGSAGRDGPVPDASCPTCSIGLALYWKFDEAAESGTTALDSSGNNFNGVYRGVVGTPTASILVPPVGFSDPFSRAFSLANQQGVQLANAPAAVKPANDLTIAVWYRSTIVDSTGSELVSLGDQYLLRLRPSQLEWTKNTPPTNEAGTGTNYQHCYVDLASSEFLDGNWHHVAAVTTPAGMRTYFDGVLRCSNASGASINYNIAAGTDLWVGRHGTQKTQFDFDGNLDEVRIYTRALSASEILGLFQGAGGEGEVPDAANDVGNADVSIGLDAADAGAPDASE